MDVNILPRESMKLCGVALMAVLFIGMPAASFALSQGQDFYDMPASKQYQNLEQFHLQQGLQNIALKKYHHAWGNFAYLLHYFPNHPTALKAIGIAAPKIKKQQEALAYFEKAISLYPTTTATYLLYSDFLMQVGKIEKARSFKRQARMMSLKEHYLHGNIAIEDFNS